MDFEVIFAHQLKSVTENIYDFQSADDTSKFIENHPKIAIPYLILIICGSIFGTIGNILIICSVLTNKVSIIKY